MDQPSGQQLQQPSQKPKDSVYEGDEPVTDRVCRFISISPAGLWAMVEARRKDEDVYIVDAANRLPVLRGLWRKIKKALIAKGWARSVDDLFPREDLYFVHGWIADHPDMFWKLEAGMLADYKLNRLEGLESYSLAIHHVMAEYAEKLPIVATLKRLASGSAPDHKVCGIDQAIVDWFSRYFGAALPFASTTIKGNALSAFVTACIVNAYGLIWIARRLRPRGETAQAYALGVDFILDDRSINMVRELVDKDQDVLFVYRNHEQKQEARNWPAFKGFEGLQPDDLGLSPKQTACYAWILTRDIWRIFSRGRQWPDELFFGAVKLPLRRLAYRNLFQARPLRAFLSRDDYNAEHIIRSQELRRAGILSLGLSHGMLAPNIVDTRTRYIDYDIYYVFGRYPYPQYHQQNWPSHVRVKPVGTFGMTRRQYDNLNGPRKPDIVFFVSRLMGERDFINQAVALANAFPDRQVIIKPKYRARSIYHLDFLALLDSPPANLVQSWGDSYELMMNCRYAVSNGSSSIAAEAVQYGLVSYVFDSFNLETPFFFRQFPSICYREIDEVIETIRRIEQGEKDYPVDELSELIPISEPFIGDNMRADIAGIKH
jgi:hypothetical protein